MISKKIMGLILASTLVFVGCTTGEAEEVEVTTENSVEDTTEEVVEGFTGTKTAEVLRAEGSEDMVIATVEFENGTPVDVTIDVKQADGTMKNEQSEAGEYVMVEGEEYALHEQHEMLADYIVENNFDFSTITLTESGATDVVAGVSVKIDTYVEAVQEAMNQVDGDATTEAFTGTKTIERLDDVTGAKGDVIVATVEFENGTPVDVTIDIRQESGRMKVEQSEAGEYVMVEGEENAAHEQIAMLEDFIVENGFDLSAITLSDSGNTDAVSGVSIKVSRYLEVVQELVTAVQNGEEYETGFTGLKTAETPFTEDGDDTVVATVVFNAGEPVDVRIDVRQASGDMKNAKSEAGEYVMVEGEEYALHEQNQMFEDFIVENGFDLSKITLTEAGGTDAVSGVSVRVSSYLEAIQAALNGEK